MKKLLMKEKRTLKTDKHPVPELIEFTHMWRPGSKNPCVHVFTARVLVVEKEDYN